MFTILTVLHLYYEVLGINILNLASLAMISFCKQMSLSINYYDGQPELYEGLTTREKSRIVKEIPTLAEYLSYMMFPGQCVVGPFFEYAPFEDFIYLRGLYGEIKMFETWP